MQITFFLIKKRDYLDKKTELRCMFCCWRVLHFYHRTTQFSLMIYFHQRQLKLLCTMEYLSVSIHLAQQHLEQDDTWHMLNRNNISDFLIRKLFNFSLFTFWSFCCKLRVKIKRIFRSASCRLKRGMNFSPVQFLKRRHKPEWIKQLYDITKHLKKFTDLIFN